MTPKSSASKSAARSLFRVLPISLFFLTVASMAWGQASGDFRSAATGNWNAVATWQRFDGSNWVAAVATPTSANGVITVRSPHVVTVTASVTVDQVVVDSGGQITLNNFTLTIANGTGTDLSVSGIFRSAGTVTISPSATIAFNANGKYQHNFTTGGTIPAASWDVASICEIVGVTNGAALSGLGQTFGNFTWNCTGQTSNVGLAAALTTINGNFTVTSTGSGSLILSSSGSWALSVGGNYSQTAGTMTFSTGTNHPGTMTIAGNFSLSSGTLSTSEANNSLGTINVAGNFSHTGGTITENSNNVNGAIVFNGTSTQNYTSGGTVGPGTIDFTVNSGAKLYMGTSAITGSGSFTLSSGATLGIGSPAGITSSGATGNIQNTGSRSFSPGANYVYNGSAAQNTGNGLPATVNNLTIDNAAGVSLTGSTAVSAQLGLTNGQLSVGANTLTLNNGISVTSGTLTSGATGTVNYNQGSAGQSVLAATYGRLTFSNFNKTLASSGTIYVADLFTPGTATGHTVTGSTIEFNGSGGQTIPAFQYNNLASSNSGARTLPSSGIIKIAGSFTPGGNSYTITGSTVEYDGSAAQTLPSAFATYNNLTVNNAAGVSLAGNPTVNATLALNSGNVVTGANTLAIATAGTVTRTSGHVVGNLKKGIATGAVTKTFEIGSAAGYTPVAVSIGTVTTPGSLTASTTDGDHPNIATSGLVSTESVNRYWTLSNSGIVFNASPGYDAVFVFLPGDLDGGADTSNFHVRKYSASNWSETNVGTRTPTSTQATGLTSFSDFAIGERVAHTITASAGANGSISPSGAVSVADGDNQSFTITPDACYDVADVLVDGVSVGAVASYTFTDVFVDHTIAASFTLHAYTIAASAGAGGSISPSGSVPVNCGADQSFTITANACYDIANVLVDGVSQGPLASYTFTNVQASHTIAASFTLRTYTIAASAGTGGSISPSGSVPVNCGADQAFTITPDACYDITDVLVDGVSVGAVASYTFTDVQVGHTIAASFTLRTYTITATAGANGSITPGGVVGVNCGADQEFAITPDACYDIADVLVDGVSVGPVASYTFTDVQVDHTIAASFVFRICTIAASAGAGGSITPSGDVSVDCGADQAFAITADACYDIADVLVDGVSVGAVASYTFDDVQTDHTIVASFVLRTYTIAASAGTGGSIDPSGDVSVNCGADQEFAITADACYDIADVLVDGVSVGAVASYTFTDVQVNHTIAASFVLRTYTIAASAGAGGSIDPSGDVSVNCGADQEFTITADACYDVADVLVDGVSVGAVASYTFTDVQVDHTIAASFVLRTYTIAASAGTGGSIAPSGDVSVSCGADQEFAITADACYDIADVLVDGVSVGAVASYTFTDVQVNHTIAASFVLRTYTIAASAGTGGSIDPSGDVTVSCGTDQEFTITADACYDIADVLVDGVSVGAVASYTFTDVQVNYIIAASFVLRTYTIAASAAAGGSITPNGDISVNCGADQEFAITADACYDIADVLVDGISAGAVASYTFTDVQTDHTIAASFVLRTYTIAASAGAGGSIDPSGDVSVNCGADQEFTITADACYDIADVLVDGISVGAVASYTFTDVQTDHTIAASFVLRTYTIAASAGAGGSITPSGDVSVDCGADQEFAITADACYDIADVLVDGVSVGAVASYTFTDVQVDHTIAASFVLRTYTIAASAGAGGSIDPSGDVSVSCGADQEFAITADACYDIADVLVDGVSVGAVASHTFTDVQVNHIIAASFVLRTYTIAASAGAGGSITPNGDISVNCGADQEFTITADACYDIADVLVDGVSVGAVGSYTFTDVQIDHTIAASFVLRTYSIAASAGAGGSITPSGDVSVDCGADQDFTITADACYDIADVLVDGVSVGAAASYTFADVQIDHTIAASFVLRTYTIAASAGAGGSITPSGDVSVDCGADQEFTITADACYDIADVLVDGVSVGAAASYTFTDVQVNHAIAASFVLRTYTIAASAGAGGSIDPSGDVSVNCGADQGFAITADACYDIADVLVDGVSVGAAASYTFTDVQADHTIAASFVLRTYTIAASAGTGGSIDPSGSVTANCGSDQEFTITADACYDIADVLVDGVSVGAVASYTFTDVQVDHTISASFVLRTYTIAASAGTGGSIAPSGDVSVNCGADQEFTITADACYDIADVLVDGVSVGAVASYTFTDVQVDHTIAASFVLRTYTIAASAGAGGSITPNGDISVNCGADEEFTITADACYDIADVLVDGVSVGAVASYTFTDVQTDHTIAASFTLRTYAIAASAGTGGSIDPSGSVTVNCGADQEFTVTADACYDIADVLVDGVSVGVVASYAFIDVQMDHTIAASFMLRTYTIAASAGTGGSIDPSGDVSVNCGADQEFAITADACYDIADVLVDDVSVGAVASYTFTDVQVDHSIAASFVLRTYTIAASADTGGSIDPSGDVSVNCGADQEFTITADACYDIADVLVDGVSVGALASYTFTDVQEDHSIAASFVLRTYTIAASADAGGSIDPSGDVSVNCGADQEFTITADACYDIADVLVDGVSVGAVASYTFTDVQVDHTIAASFVLRTYTIGASAGTGGSIDPSGSVTANCGSDQEFTITADACYDIADVLVDGVSVGAMASYTFTDVQVDHSIAASFVLRTYTIAASAGTGGSIDPSGDVSVDCGVDQEFAITADACYDIADVLVDGVSVGAVASYTFSDVQVDHSIAASFVLRTYTIAASAGPGGSIAPSGDVSVNCGADREFTITADACYDIADILVDGVSVGAVGSYTFTDIQADHSIAASFVLRTYTIAASAGAGGSITPSGDVSVNCGADREFTITADACYDIADILVDGVSVGAVASYIFTDVQVDHTIAASFVLRTYTIAASAGPGGSITPSGDVSVDCGADQEFTITADACYDIADVLVDGVSVGAVGSYTFSDVQVDHSIAASFVLRTYTIAASAGAGGSITPSGDVSVDCSADQEFTITADACYDIADVLVDGVSVGAVASYTFTDVQADHTIAASFVLRTYTIAASAGAGGSITPSGDVSVDCGADQEFTIAADACYDIADVLVDGVSVGAAASYTFTDVQIDHTIAASFVLRTYTIAASAGAGGSITPSGDVSVDCGADQEFTITADACYDIANVLVDGVPVGAVASYTFTDVQVDHSIAASFVLRTYTIAASAGTGGSIDPSGDVSVNCGADQEFAITADTCYDIADVLVDGVSVGAVASYTFTDVQVNHTIAASFVLRTYTIAASAGAGGSIDPSGDVSVNCGADQEFAITADACYDIADVLVDGVSVGAVASYTFTDVQVDHSIAASFVLRTYTIAASAGTGGSIDPSGDVSVSCGADQEFAITADACYDIADVLVDGVSVGAVASYTFTDVQTDHTIAASFVLRTYTIAASAGTGGSIDPSGDVSVNCGADQEFAITADACYDIADVLVDGVSVGAVASYTFTDVQVDHTIAASFVLRTYTIAASAGAGGSIDPSGDVSVNCGADQEFAITADACYDIADVLVDGVSVGAVASYTFTDVQVNHTIAASFVLRTYTIAASAGTGGSIDPSGDVTVSCGTDQEFTITADACYDIADVLVDGVSVGAVASYTFTDVQVNHAIAASFVLRTYTIAASAGAGGSIDPSGDVSVNCGADQEFAITADACYDIADVLVDGVSVGAVASYTFTDVQVDHSIAASFVLRTYTIAASAGTGGSIDPSGSVTANCGSDQEFTITADACYDIADVLVDGVSVGAMASYTFTDVQVDHSIAASFVLRTYTIAASAGTGGSIAPSGDVSVNCGADQEFTITADACYDIADVLVDGVSVGAVASYTFSDVQIDHTIAASFVLRTYTISASAGAGGSITPSGDVSVDCGADQEFTITADACYDIADVLVDGVSVGAAASYIFSDVQADHTIAASFVLRTYTIAASSGPGGSITPSGDVSVNCGADQEFAITADACYDIADVLVDGISVGAVASYTFIDVQVDHTISASFVLRTYTIAASAGTGGSIDPSGDVSVNCGADQEFTITADACYDIADVLVDGVSVGAVASYTFTDVQVNHTIAASFVLRTYTIAASAGAGGSIDPSGDISVNCGADQEFAITADACYDIADVLVDGVSVGAVASYTFTDVQVNHAIAASFVLRTYTIAASAGAGGSIDPSGDVSVNCGADQEFAITADACYDIADVLVDGISVGAVASYTFIDVQVDHTISASFVLRTYTIAASAGTGGSIDPSGDVSVNCGADQEFTITADACYDIADVLVDGVSVGAVASYTFTDVQVDHTIAASFVLRTYTIAASAGTGGSIDPSGDVSVNCGADQGFAITADACYDIADVLVDGVSVGAVASYTFSDVQIDHTIAASFVLRTYTIAASAGAGGSIDPSGDVSVNCGADQEFAITADACYDIADVLVDGVSVGAVGSYTFTDVQVNHSIAASFVLRTYTIAASAGTGGSIDPSGDVSVNCGADQEFAITADACYDIADVLVDGVSVGAVASYTFTDVQVDHTIAASFVLRTYTIAASAGTGGSIAPSGDVSVNCGADQEFTVTADACYDIADVLVDGVSVGVVASYAFTDVQMDHTIAASFVLRTYTIAASAGAGGSITPSGDVSVDCGADQEFAITADACYDIADVLVDGVSVGAVASYTFTDVQIDHTIAASFVLRTYTIAASAGAGGSITPSGDVSVDCGADQEFAITADACYDIADVLVDGVSVGAVASYTFTDVQIDHTIAASFVLRTYTIAASAGTGGSIDPSGDVSVNCGADQEFAITADACYDIADVLVDGVSVGAVASYTFTDVQVDHTIAASFVLRTYTIAASAGAGGSIDPSGDVSVNCGADQEFAITADACYDIADVLVDGVSVGAVASYTFTDVQVNHTIAASFVLRTYTIAASAGTGGSIDPSGDVTVSCGTDQEFTITADACYDIADVLVDGVSVGAVASYTFTDVQVNHAIAASFVLRTYTITASAGAGGSIDPSGDVSVNCGADQEFAITADACYDIADVLVDGVSVGAVASYTFTDVQVDHSIAASFVLRTYTIAASAGTGGSIDPSGSVTANCGSDQEFTITADACYDIADVLVDGVSVGAMASYTFTDVQVDHSIAASFVLRTYTIAASAGTGGSIAPSGDVSVNCGADQEFTITADACYDIADVLVDGVSVGAVASYTFSDVQIDHTIAASFVLRTYTISASAGAGGSITPSGDVSVDCGADQEFTITADACYDIADVLVDGVSVGAAASYIFSDVQADHTIAASFVLRTYTIAASSGPGGSITPSGDVSVNCGADQEFAITADACYDIADVLVDGISVGAVASYTFIDVQVDHTISASFVLRTYTIAASAGTGGSIDPSGDVSVNCGADQEFTITADACYDIADVLVDGVSVGAVASYTFTDVQVNHTIAASFVLRTYTIAASAGAGGSIDPSGDISVNCGADQEFAITADACYDIADVLVDGVSVGAVASYTFTDVQVNHAIAASFVLRTYTIAASAGAGGSIDPSGDVSVNCGADQEFAITADACYDIADVLVDGISVGAVASYTFIDVQVDHTISASFVLRTYTIAASAGTGGSIDPSGDVSVNCGADQEFTITADACYDIADVLVDGVSVGAVASYTFTDVQVDHTIAASFVLRTYTIAASAGTGGSIDPSGDVSVNCGADQGFAITADACYDIADVLVDGVSVGAVASYTFSDVQIDHTIAASFVLRTYTIAASAGAGGSIDPSGDVSVNCGADQEFAITADACYDIADVLVDGVSVGAVASYTFTDVQVDHTIAASFVLRTYTIAASAGAGGSIDPSGDVSVNCGADQEFAITADACYDIADVLVDGVSVGAVASYTFTDVQVDHTIAASFVLRTYTIAASAGTGGSIAPSGDVSVNCGADQEFTVTADACYDIADVLVDGVSVGVVASYAFTDVQMDHTIAASFVLRTYTIAASAGAGGSITPSGDVSVDCGADQEFAITADACYDIADVLVDGVSVGAVASYTFTDVQIDHTIAASFVLRTYTIAASAGAGGSITPSGDVSVDCGADQEFTITADACYDIADVLVDGVSVGAAASYTFTDVQIDHTIAASFVLRTYTIAASAGTGGSIDPSGDVSVNCGADQEFAITADACYDIADVLVDGVSVGAVASYTFTDVQVNHIIAASFVLRTYTIAASAGAGGSITPNGDISVNCGADQEFAITADACYDIADVLVDGVSVGAVASYIFTDVQVNHTIAASFVLRTYTIAASAGAGGSITPNGDISVNCGADQEFTITADACYDIADVLVDGVSVGAAASYTFADVQIDHTIAASFVLRTYTIAASAGAGGSITPSGDVSVDCGADQEFTITADACYDIADVLVDGVSVGAVASYTFTDVQLDHTIAASFVLRTYTIAASDGAGGSITPSGDVSVDCGADQEFTIAADACYGIADVLVDGVSVGAVASYTFTDVQIDHTIAASFVLRTYTIAASAGAGGSITPSGDVSVDCGADQDFVITADACYDIADVLVDGVSVGAVASYTFTDVQLDHTIAASFVLRTYTIAASAGAGGSITPSGDTSVDCGADQEFTITADACYDIADVLVDGVSVGAVASYTFSDVQIDHTITASFVLRTYTIAASAGAGGSITPSGDVSVDCGADQEFTITADACYDIADVLVDGVSVGAVASYTFTDVQADHTIAASFVLRTYTIAALAGAGGFITPSGDVSVDCGADQEFTITADACYDIADVLVDGVSVGTVASYTFTDVQADHTITASFVLRTYTIAASAGAGGFIAPSGDISVACGADQEFTITADACYAIADVLVDGVSVGAVGSYAFTDVQADHTIAASFVLRTYTIAASAGPGGSITPSGDVAVDCGADQEFTITADACYDIADVLVDGVSVGAVASYTFTDVQADHTIAGSFVLRTYNIAASAGAGGSIAPTGDVSVDCGTDQEFTITAEACYDIADVLVDGVSVGAVASYTFTDVQQDHTIAASFVLRTYTIAASAGTGGSITPSGEVEVNCGDSLTFTIEADSCFAIADVLVDGVSQGPLASFTFTEVTMNHTIDASFIAAVYSITATAGPNGSITPSGVVPVSCGDDQSFAMSPDAGYQIADVLVDGLSQGPLASYTFDDVHANHTIEVLFAANMYTLTTVVVGGGSITVDPDLPSYPYGSHVTLTAVEAPGWQFDHWSLREDNPLTIVITDNTEVTAFFIDIMPPTIEVTSPNGGEIWITSTHQNITWIASDNAGVTSVDLELSLDGGLTYPGRIASGLPNTGTYDWTVSETPSQHARVRATAHDEAAHSMADESDADFIIESDLTAAGEAMPAGEILSVYPNPGTPGNTHVLYRLPAAGTVTLNIYDISGRLIRGLSAEFFDGGLRMLQWDGKDMNGQSVATGIYFIRLSSSSGAQATKQLVFFRN